jgi:hypothetical protein
MSQNLKADNEVWWSFHYCMTKANGFMHDYHILNELINDTVMVNGKEYKINAYDIKVLNYLIGWTQNKSVCLYQSNQHVADRLGMSLNTFKDSLKKLRALDFIEERKIGGHTCRMYPRLEFIAQSLGYTLNAVTDEQKEEIKKEDSMSTITTVNQDDNNDTEEECPF